MIFLRYLIAQIGSVFTIQKYSMQKPPTGRILKDYILSESKLLGSGSTGQVYKGYAVNSGNQVAIKVIELSTIDNEVSEYLLLMEKNALMMINHPNVLRGFDVQQENGKCYMVTEYCNGGTLKDLIARSGKLSEDRSLHIFQGILRGYSDCVRKRIVHRDMKPANIMLHNGEAKIIDFGYCMIEGFSKPKLEYNVGSPSYMAPESYKWNMYNQKTQIWGLGVTYYECITGRTLDQGRKMSDTFRELLEIGIYFPDHVSQGSKQLINKCLEYDPKYRFSCSQLLREVAQLRKQTSQISTQYSSNAVKNPSQSFLHSTPPSSANNLPLYQNIHNLTNSNYFNSATSRERNSNLLELNNKQEILRPRLDNRVPETTKQNVRIPLYQSTMFGSMINSQATDRLRNYNTVIRNKYQMNIQDCNLRDYHKLPVKRELCHKPQKTYNYNQYGNTAPMLSNRQPSMTYR